MWTGLCLGVVDGLQDLQYVFWGLFRVYALRRLCVALAEVFFHGAAALAGHEAVGHELQFISGFQIQGTGLLL